MSEVYEVCQRLKAAGFPQDRSYRLVHERVPASAWGDLADALRSEDNSAACPNASECMKFARGRWPRFVGGLSPVPGFYDEENERQVEPCWEVLIGNDSPPVNAYAQHDDPDQAARLALAAALEADNAK